MNLLRRIARSKRIALGIPLAGLMLLGAQGSLSTAAQPAPTPMMQQYSAPTITVTGYGSVAVTPDTASVTIGVNVVEPVLKDAQAKASDQMTAIITTLKAEGIEEADIQTSNYSVNVNQSYDASGTPGEVTGYTVNNQVSVTVRDLSGLGALLDSVVANGANSIWGVSFYLADPTDAAKQARELAVADAMERADQIAAAAGSSVGDIVSISETTSPYATDLYAKGAGGAGVPIQTGSSTVSAAVSITFELKQ